MVMAAWDTSNLVALYKDGKQCVTCCDAYPLYDPGPKDCCCFLDPATLPYNAATNYMMGDLAESGTPYTYMSLTNNNQNNPLADTDHWEKVSETGQCGNADWNSVSPFGGPGKTPYVYTANVQIRWTDSGHVTRLVAHLLKDYTSNRCHWVLSGRTYDSDGYPYDNVGPDGGIRLMLTGGDPDWGANAMFYINRVYSGSNCYQYSGIPLGYYRLYTKLWKGPFGIDDFCKITYAITDHEALYCIRRRVTADINPSLLEAGLMDISWRPGQIFEWDSGMGYVPGDIVAWKSIFYVCTADNTNQEPPNASYWDVI